jgi:N-acetylglutamate synthase-like GNAT family acetyltransferase
MDTDSTYQVINASPDDWGKIQWLSESLGLDRHDMQLDQFKVCKQGEELLGIVRMKQHKDCLELCTLGVAEMHRGRGIGSSLVRSLLEDYPDEVYLVTEIPAYFQKLGFIPGGEHILSLNEKKDVCLHQLSCSQPVIMVKQ